MTTDSEKIKVSASGHRTVDMAAAAKPKLRMRFRPENPELGSPAHWCCRGPHPTQPGRDFLCYDLTAEGAYRGWHDLSR